MSRSLTKPTPPRERSLLIKLLDEVPKEELAPALDAADDPRAAQLLDLLFDANPDITKLSFPALVRKCGLAYGDVLRIITKYHQGKGIIRMSRRAPKVMDDVAADAESKDRLCSACYGDGEIRPKGKKKPVECPKCGGSGRISLAGDSESRKLMFETLGLVKKGGAIQVNVNAGGIASVEDEMERVTRVVDAPAESHK